MRVYKSVYYSVLVLVKPVCSKPVQRLITLIGIADGRLTLPGVWPCPHFASVTAVRGGLGGEISKYFLPKIQGFGRNFTDFVHVA